MRQCRTCKKNKPKEYFYKNISYSTGYSKQCKSCAKKIYYKSKKINKEGEIKWINFYIIILKQKTS